MLVNKNDNTNSHVRFVNYTGKYPCLCMGILTLEIDGLEYTFGSVWEKPKPDFDSFWHTGGHVHADRKLNFNVEHGEWEINVDDIPEQFRKYASEIDEVFNSSVDYGCCGGCI